MNSVDFERTVSAIIGNKEGKILLLKHKKNKGKWILPAGKVEDGEYFYQALDREMKEELDIEVTEYDVCSERTIRCDRLEGIRYYHNLTFCIYEYNGDIKNMEIDKHPDMKFVSKDEALELLKEGKTYDYVYDAITGRGLVFH